MSRALEGKTALVTGASRGLGAAMARRLAADGARVFVNYRSNEARAEEVVAAIAASGGQAQALQGDLSSIAGIDAFFDKLEAAMKEAGIARLDILVNNAGTNAHAVLEETDEAAFDALFQLNVKGVFFVTRRASPLLADGGRIINLSSGLTRFTYPQYLDYSASKGAIDVLTRGLAQHLGPRGITVNAVAPGATETDMTADFLSSAEARAGLCSVTALGKVGQPDDIADVVAFLASKDARWVTGQRIEASGGAHL